MASCTLEGVAGYLNRASSGRNVEETNYEEYNEITPFQGARPKIEPCHDARPHILHPGRLPMSSGTLVGASCHKDRAIVVENIQTSRLACTPIWDTCILETAFVWSPAD